MKKSTDRSEILFNLLVPLNAELAIDRASRDFDRNRLKRKIDEALDRKDKAEFMRLTELLKKFDSEGDHKDG